MQIFVLTDLFFALSYSFRLFLVFSIALKILNLFENLLFKTSASSLQILIHS